MKDPAREEGTKPPAGYATTHPLDSALDTIEKMSRVAGIVGGVIGVAAARAELHTLRESLTNTLAMIGKGLRIEGKIQNGVEVYVDGVLVSSMLSPEAHTMADACAALRARAETLMAALAFVHDLAEEELSYAKVGTGGEVALRHIVQHARAALEAQ